MAHARRYAVAGLTAILTTVSSVRPARAESHAHSPAAAATNETARDAKRDVPATPPAPSAAASPTASPAPHVDETPVAPDEALRLLVDGNGRFVAGTPSRPHMGQDRLCDTFANGQHPYAAILSCADSRVPVEHVFDAGIGDLFVVRVAGNVADVDEIGTLEYGVEHLGISVIAVVGHTKCGAVTAVVEGAHVTANVAKLVDNIVPAVTAARQASPKLTGPRLLGRAIRMNVQRAMADLSANSDVIRERVKDGRLKIVGGVYDLHSGEVDWLDEQPGLASTANESPTKLSSMSSPSSRNDRDEQSTPSKPLAETARKSPAAVDDHQTPAPANTGNAHASKKDEAHSAKKADADDESAAHSTPHAEKESPSHADPHAAKAETPGQPAAAVPAKKDNFFILGGMLAASCVVSAVLVRFTSGPRPQPAGPAAAPAPAAPAAH